MLFERTLAGCKELLQWGEEVLQWGEHIDYTVSELLKVRQSRFLLQRGVNKAKGNST